MIQKPIAFLKRDLLVAASYRLQFLMQMAGILFSSLTFFFLSKLIGAGMGNQLAAYGGDYFAFVLIGVAFTDYLSISLGAIAGQIRNAQLLGTLEALLVTPTSVSVILFSSCLYNFSFTSLRVFIYLATGIILFGLKLHVTSLFATFVIFMLTILAFTGIGLMSAAFIIAFKQGSPISWIISTTSGLLGGVLYPVAVLPAWLKPWANLLPITHALEAMRQVLLNGATLNDVSGQVLALIIFAVILLPIGLTSFSYGLNVAKREGSLVHY